MSRGPLASVLHHLLRYREATESRETTDAELLRRFASSREQEAFATLVRRHAPLVMTVCRRTLTDTHEAEDAFQATFLVLAAKAGSIRRPELLHNWLYGVAFRIARRLQRRHGRQVTGREEVMNTVVSPDAPSEPTAWRPILDEELQRLPDRYRAPLLLCYVEGQTQEHAARRLGWTPGSVKGRLERARVMLRNRLIRRGVTLTSAALLAALPSSAQALVPERLLVATVHAGCSFAAGEIAVQTTAGLLAREALRAARVNRCLLAAIMVLGTGLAGGGTVLGLTALAHPTRPETLLAGTPPVIVPPAINQNEPPAIAPEVLRAWRDAGMQLFWFGKLKGSVPERDGADTDGTRLVGPLVFGARFSRSGAGAVVPLHQLPDPGVALFLDLSHTRTTDEQLKELHRFKQLTHLRLTETAISDEGMKEIGKLHQLQDLWVGHISISAAGVRDLRGLKHLRSFSIGGNGARVGDAEMHEIAQHLPELRYLEVAGNESLTDRGLQEIPRLTKLRRLIIGSPVVTEAGLRHIAALDQLEWLGLGSTPTTDAGFQVVTKLSHLRFLNLGFTRISDAGLTELRHFPDLNILYLPKTKLSDACLENLKACRSLNRLILPRSISDSGLAEIKTALPNCQITRYDDVDG